MDFSALPKIELHLHLDCSMSFDVVRKLDPDISREEYKQKFIAPEKCRDLADYISRSQQEIRLMQTPRALELVVEDLFNQLQADNVIYAEIRFAPLEHLKEGMAAKQVAETVNGAVENQIERTGIEAGVIFCTLRHYSEEQSMQTVKLVEKFDGTRIVGFDIAADEAGYPLDNHIAAFEYASSKGINCTAHAGEARGPESVRETINKLKSSRIGHGVRSIEDKELVERLKEDDLHLEVCPTSNIQTNVFESIENHTVDRLYNAGVSLSINTDGRTISNVTLEEEYNLLADEFNWGREQLLKCNLEAIDHAFTSDKIKQVLRKKIKEGFTENEN